MKKPPIQVLEATGQAYYRVPELEPGRCKGCAIDDSDACFAHEFTCGREACDDQGVIYIEATDEALADYIVRRLNT